MEHRRDRAYAPSSPFDIEKIQKNIEKLKVPHKLDNNPLGMPLSNWLTCVNMFVAQFHTTSELSKQATRLDIETVCAIELYELKKAVLEEGATDYNKWLESCTKLH